MDMPLHFGPMSAWSVIIFTVLLLALTEYFRKTFQTQRDAGVDKKEITERLKRLESSIEKLDDHVRDGHNEERVVSRREFNGLGDRVNRHEREMGEIHGEARQALALGKEAALGVSHLTQRLEDLIGPLSAQVNEIYRMKLAEQRGQGGSPHS